MRAVLSPIGREDGRFGKIEVDGRVGLFRSGHDVLADVNGRSIETGLRDASVSRKKNGTAPVEVAPAERSMVVRNNGNKNGVTIDSGFEEVTLDTGEDRTVTRDAIISIGYNSQLRLRIESDEGSEVRDTLSREEYDEVIEGTERRGSVIEGVDPAAYVASVAMNVRREASARSVNDCLKFLTELYDFVLQRPGDDDAYQEVRNELAVVVDGLERRVSEDSLRNVDLDDERIEQIERVTHRVERLYARDSKIRRD